MNDITREQQLLQTFARLADSLTNEYDAVDVLQNLVESCQELLDATAAGVLLSDGTGDLELVASTSEASRLVEVMQLSADAGPCIESYTTGRVVALGDIEEAPAEWWQFRDSARAQGFRSVVAVPLRLRQTTIGTLNLLRNATGELPPDDLIAARAFADVATIGILHERSLRESELVREQLQRALNSRVVIEQAKGVVAHTRKIPVDEAFTVIRDYARHNQLSLAHVASRLVDRSLAL
jgi:GAF domain-containing protein